jgi:CHAT domain
MSRRASADVPPSPRVESDLDLLRAVAAAADDGTRAAALFRAPRLLVPEIAEQLSEAIADEDDGERTRLVAALGFVRRMREAVEVDLDLYPLGLGPVERLWERQAGGEIRAERARELAGSAEILDSLAPVYVAALSGFAVVSAENGDWRQALELQRLLVAAVEALPPTPTADEVSRTVSLDWPEVARWALLHVPDARILRSAQAAGEAVAEEGLRTRNRLLSGTALYRLGVLFLDPYTVGAMAFGPSSPGTGQHVILAELGEDVTRVSEEEWRMPSDRNALNQAAQYFRASADVSEGRVRGLAREGLASTLYALEAAGEPIDRDELVSVAALALEELDPAEDVSNRLQVQALLDEAGAGDAAHDERVDALDATPDELERRFGRREAVNIVLHQVARLSARDPARALRVLRDSRELFRRSPFDVRVTQAVAEIQLFQRLYAPDSVERIPGAPIWEEADRLRERARAEGWDARALSASLIGLAAAADGSGEADGGVILLDEAIELDPEAAPSLGDAIRLLRALLLSSSALELASRSESAKAVRAACGATATYLAIDATERARSALEQVWRLARGDPALVSDLVEGLGPLILELETRVGEGAVEVLQRIWRDALTSITGREVDASLVFTLLQRAKGARFATLLDSPSPYSTAADDVALELLARIERAERAADAEASGGSETPEALFSEEVVLAAYVAPEYPREGATAEERLANLQHRFDAHVERRLVGARAGTVAAALDFDEVQKLLDSRTVLLSWLLGAAPDGRMTNYLVLVTQEDVWAGGMAHGAPGYGAWLDGADRTLTVNAFAPMVAWHRELIQAEPSGRAVSAEGAHVLGRSLEALLGSALEPLEACRRQGKDHLCIAPHGPFHFYPLHLLGQDGDQLCDRWIVTYLPNVHLLSRRRGPAPTREHVVSAVGLSFDDDDALEPLERAVAEAEAVASAFDSKPILEAKATKAAMVQALATSRYVHVATHGMQNVEAPAFQCVFLTPTEGSDGRLYAHEVLALDLRGLELLTLSACETALGRFDRADNLRGMPASFLLAGVRTLVGTLWPAEDSASETFFSSFYSHLRADPSVLDAFAGAQQATRTGHPEYRDWGTFYLTGAW